MTEQLGKVGQLGQLASTQRLFAGREGVIEMTVTSSVVVLRIPWTVLPATRPYEEAWAAAEELAPEGSFRHYDHDDYAVVVIERSGAR